MPNAARAWQVLDHIHGHLDHHDQGQFMDVADNELPDYNGEGIPLFAGDLYFNAGQVVNSCGTTACFAGWTALLTGHALNAYGIAENGRHAQSIASKELDIDDEQAELLFFDAQDIQALDEAVIQVFGPRPAAADAV